MADLDELAGRLDHELPDVAWAEPVGIRARGRSRRRRSALLAVVAVLVVVGGAGWLAAGTRSPSNPPTTAATPSDDLLPEWALLRPGDVGPGYRVIDSQLYRAGTFAAQPFGAVLDCPAYVGLGITAYHSYLGLRFGQFERDGAPMVFEEAGRFPAGVAEQVLVDVGRVLAACDRWELPDEYSPTPDRTGTTTFALRVLERDFAGDEALLIRLTLDTVDTKGVKIRESRTTLAVVRVGDLVATVQTERDVPDQMRLLGQRAADRLCSVEQRC